MHAGDSQFSSISAKQNITTQFLFNVAEFQKQNIEYRELTMLILKRKRRKQNAEVRRKAKAPSVEQKLLGGGNVVIRKANRSEKFADIVADLGVGLDSPTPSESQRERIKKRRN